MNINPIALVGGSGFVGRHLVCELSRRGYEVRVLTRCRERHRELLVHPKLKVEQVNVHDAGSLWQALRGCGAVINLTGILNQSSRPERRFEAVHVSLAGELAAACQALGIGRLLHMSALGAGADAPSEYLRTKAGGEDRVHQCGDDVAVTSFRPAVIFGHDDDFFNRFAGLLELSPVVFPLACPNSRFAPVFVGDVARAMAACIDDESSFGQRYDLCGPRTYTLRQLVKYIADLKGQRRLIVGLGDFASRLQARLLGLLPATPFSYDNYLSLQRDCVSDNNALPQLDIEPTTVESVVPGFLGECEPNRRYRALRTGAGRT